MQTITGIAVIKRNDGTPAEKLGVRMQVFTLASGKWSVIASAQADAEGKVTIMGPLALPDDGPAPQVRLVRATGTAILSEGGRISYDAASGALSIEFGEIVDFGQETVTTVPIDTQFAGLRHVIGGGPAAIRFGARGAGGLAAATAASGAAAAAESEPQVAILSRRVFERESTINALQLDLANEKKVTERLEANVARIPELERMVAEKATVESALQAERGKIVQLESRIGQLIGENERLAAPKPKTIAMSAMAANIGAEIKAAQDTMNAQAGGLALASVRINLKGLVEDGATKVTFPDAKDLRPEVTGALTNVDLEFLGRGDPPPADTNVTVPDLRRLTESAVRQVLHSLGLRLDPVTGPAGAGGVASGQAALQAPEQGARIGRGSSVTVVFAT